MFNMFSSIVKPAKSLKTNALRKELLQQTVSTFLYQINSAIESSNKENKNKTAVLLPMDFNLPDYIPYEAFRIETYFTIVSDLKSKGYKVKIVCMDDRKILVVQWDVEASQDVKHMEEFLMSISE